MSLKAGKSEFSLSYINHKYIDMPSSDMCT